MKLRGKAFSTHSILLFKGMVSGQPVTPQLHSSWCLRFLENITMKSQRFYGSGTGVGTGTWTCFKHTNEITGTFGMRERLQESAELV